MTSRKPNQLAINKQFKKIKSMGGMTEYELCTNGLRLIHFPILGSEVISSNIVYLVGSRDEMPGETGLAHMLEHMLFKPTREDKKRKQDSGAMVFERQFGVILNANTWRERTGYFFSYPKEHVTTAFKIEADRMTGIILTDQEFLPERTNVLSEFDMYNSSPEFALENAIYTTALQSHPYRHEVIGFREDIEAYTTEKLANFYRQHYAPNNAVLIVVGDIDEKTLFGQVYNAFGALKAQALRPRLNIKEPKQEGKRHVEIKRPTTTNIVALTIKHDGFPSLNWTKTMLLFKILAGGTDSILYRQFVDTGRVSEVNFRLEPTPDNNLGIIYLTLSPTETHAKIETDVLAAIKQLTTTELKKELVKTIAQIIDNEPFERDSSLGIMHELVEYVAAGNWSAYFDTAKTVKSVTPTMLKQYAETIFQPEIMTTGYFIGTRK